jgi:hypothetical protein
LVQQWRRLPAQVQCSTGEKRSRHGVLRHVFLGIAVIAGIDSGKIPAKALASMSSALRHNN